MAEERSAEASPETAAPGQAAEAVANTDTDRPRSLEDSLQEARARLDRGESLFPGEDAGADQATEEVIPETPEAAEAEPDAEVSELPEGWTLDEQGRVRDEQGRFATAGQEGDAEAEASDARAEGEDPEPDESRLVRLPGRSPDDPPEEIEVDDPQVAERLRMLANNGMRRAEFNRQMESVAQQRQEIEHFQTELEADPVGWIMTQVESPELRQALARHLLADEGVYDAVIEDVASWDRDPVARRAAAAELRADRLERQQRAQQEVATRAQVKQNLREIQTSIRDLIPDDIDGAEAQRFYAYAIREVQDYVNSIGTNHLDPAQVPVLLERQGLLRLFGLHGPRPEPVASPSSAAPAAPSRAERPAAGARPAPTVEEAHQAQQKLRKRIQTRRAAATVAPAGAGATPTRIRPPEGQGVEDRVAWYKRQRGLT